MWPTCLIRRKQPSSSKRLPRTRRSVSEADDASRKQVDHFPHTIKADGRLNDRQRREREQFASQLTARPIGNGSFQGNSSGAKYGESNRHRISGWDVRRLYFTACHLTRTRGSRSPGIVRRER